MNNVKLPMKLAAQWQQVCRGDDLCFSGMFIAWLLDQGFIVAAAGEDTKGVSYEINPDSILIKAEKGEEAND